MNKLITLFALALFVAFVPTATAAPVLTRAVTTWTLPADTDPATVQWTNFYCGSQPLNETYKGDWLGRIDPAEGNTFTFTFTTTQYCRIAVVIGTPGLLDGSELLFSEVFQLDPKQSGTITSKKTVLTGDTPPRCITTTTICTIPK